MCCYLCSVMMFSHIFRHNSGLNSFSNTDFRIMGLTSSILSSASIIKAGTNFINSSSDGSSYQLKIGMPFSG